MRWWPDRAARLAVGAIVVGLAIELARRLALVSLPPRSLGVVVAVVGLLVLAATQYSAASWRRIQPALREEFPLDGRARVAPGGQFEWHPEGETRIGIRHGITHRWWDAERGPRYDVALAFDIPDEVPGALLAHATKRALRAATSALPGRGKARAKAAARDEPGPTSLVRVRIAVQGVGADAAWARVAAEHFARAFLATLKKGGHLADRRVSGSVSSARASGEHALDEEGDAEEEREPDRGAPGEEALHRTPRGDQ